MMLILLCLVLTAKFSLAQGPLEKSNLKVLYVGGSPELQMYKSPDLEQADVRKRMASFGKMLKTYFNTVTVIDAKDYQASSSSDYDVTVIDGIVDKAKAATLLSNDFTKPILFIGEMGSLMGKKIGLKFDWYCLCLGGDAHSMRTNHAIFKGPFNVKIPFKQKETPLESQALDYTGKLPKMIPTWTVQTAAYTDGKAYRPGLVAHGAGFEDSPDAEFISGGNTSKDIGAVAVGRHGSFLQWGFSASPDYLTPEAKTVLANAIVYISKFDGKRVIARKFDERITTTHDLEQLRDQASIKGLDGMNMYYKNMAFFGQRMAQQYVDKKARGEKLTAEEEAMINRPAAKAPEPFKLESFLRASQGVLFAKYGTDLKAYQNYYNANMGYFFGRGGLTIDEDLKSLKIKHSDPKVLATAISMWEKGKDVEMAKRILDRYTLVSFATPEEWRAWYEKNKNKLFFSESGGYYFLINSDEKGVEGNDYQKKLKQTAYNKIKTGETDDQNAVSVAAASVALENGNKEIVVKFKIHPGYHIYGFVSEKDPFIKTEVNFELPEGYKIVTPLQSPLATIYNANNTTIYHDEAIFTQEIAGRGSGEVICKVSYQCCNKSICFPPVEAIYKVNLAANKN